MPRPHSMTAILAIGVCLFPAIVSAQNSSWTSFGVRGGFSSNVPHGNLYQYELFGIYKLPWELRHASGWGVSTGIDGSVGVLASEGDYGFIGAIGPAASVGKTGFPLELDLGVSGAILSRDTFGGRDYNGNAQFISHGGFNLRFSRRLGLVYRFQHMSNAGFNGVRNPGVNLHLFGLQGYIDDTP